MAQYLSADLRIRVIGAVEAGMSRNAAARRFGVSIASAVRWMDEYLRTGRSAPKPRGGDRRSGRIEAQAELLMRAIDATPDITRWQNDGEEAGGFGGDEPVQRFLDGRRSRPSSSPSPASARR